MHLKYAKNRFVSCQHIQHICTMALNHPRRSTPDPKSPPLPLIRRNPCSQTSRGELLGAPLRPTDGRRYRTGLDIYTREVIVLVRIAVAGAGQLQDAQVPVGTVG